MPRRRAGPIPTTGETNMILQWTQHADAGWNWATGIGVTP